MEKDKEYLENIILWYRNEYHKKDFGHSEMIEKIKNAKDYSELETHYKTIDSWSSY
jgi:hypothetical protein